jgi:Uma2 family endonuclease
MTHAAQPRPVAKLTVAEFAAHPAAAGPSELVGGEIRMMAPASGAHGAVAGAIFASVNAFVEQRQLGVCFPDNTGFALPGIEKTVRSPDMAFVRGDRLPAHGLGSGFVEVAPDLIVEVLSPTETASDLEEKLRDYDTAGTTLVWVIDPVKRVIIVRAADAPVRWLPADAVLNGGSVLPGFSVSVAGLFARLALV